MADERRAVHLSRSCTAPAEVVYDLLAEVSSHLEWGGRKQRRVFRLLSIDGPAVPLAAGSTFTSTGNIPGSARRWRDESVVTKADRPHRVEFRTEARVARGGRGQPMLATYLHRYDIQPDRERCQVDYTFTEIALEQPLLRMRLPIVRALIWRTGIPMMMGFGFGNLIKSAEQVAAGARR